MRLYESINGCFIGVCVILGPKTDLMLSFFGMNKMGSSPENEVPAATVGFQLRTAQHRFHRSLSSAYETGPSGGSSRTERTFLMMTALLGSERSRVGAERREVDFSDDCHGNRSCAGESLCLLFE